MADKPAPSLPSRHLDIYLLRCFQALVSEAHVTHAAEKMGIGQLAMSTTLARLRLLFADPILMRTEKGMVATSRTMAVLRKVNHALELIDQTLTEGTLFDPLTAKVSFRISASESVGFLRDPPKCLRSMSLMSQRLCVSAAGIHQRRGLI
jgi:DNA-binding transcriptional LysR family regulator